MKNSFNQFTAALFLVFLFVGCEADEPFSLVESDSQSPVVQEIYETNKLQENSLPAYFIDQLKKFESVPINKYTVKFLKRVGPVPGANTTTFIYEVTGNGYTPQSDSFTLELPGCAFIGGTSLASWNPLQPTTVYQNAIKWNNSISKDGSQQYSVTYNGDIPLGIISATLTRGSISETKDIVGPCQGVYTISGSVYNIIDSDGEMLDTGLGIGGFLIDLFDANDVKMTTVATSEDGSYSFMVLKGDYKIVFRDDILRTSEKSYTFENLNEDKLGYNFAYAVNPSKITGQLDNKTIIVNTEPTKFWVQELKNAGKKNGLYSKEVIIGWLEAIEAEAEPFNFGTDKVAGAQEFLSRPIKSDLDYFLQQLLTAELNVASGRGALLDPGTDQESLNAGFNNAILNYSENVACESGACPQKSVESDPGATRAAETKAISSRDTQMLLSFNGSGGV